VPVHFIPELGLQFRMIAEYGAWKEENWPILSTSLFTEPSFEQGLALGAATLVLLGVLGALYLYRKQLRLPYYLARIPPPATPDAPDLLVYHRAALPTHYPRWPSLGGRPYKGYWVINRAAPYALLMLFFLENYFEQFKLVASFTGFASTRPLKVGLIGGEEPQPHDTYFLMALWFWCGLVWVCTPRRSKPPLLNAWGRGPTPEIVEFPPDVGGGHQGLADEHGANAGRTEA
jgi:hypothetical protein